MKIEMGESLFYSWLKHVKNCRIVQTNWKSSTAWNICNIDKLDQMYKEASDKFNEWLIKNNSNENKVSTFMRQAEIDVVGQSSDDNKIYAVDVAFHSETCNYSNGRTNEDVISKKIIRAAFCLYGYFNVTEGHIVFATPKFGETSLIKTLGRIKEIKSFLKNHKLNFDIECICNKDFYDKIMKPTLEKCKNNSDTAELFMRSCTLYEMLQKYNEEFNVKAKQTAKVKKKAPKTTSCKLKTNTDKSVLKIGEIVKIYIFSVLEEGKITGYELQKLQDKEYSKQIFDINYPLLSKVRIINGQPRYYANRILINNEEYYICQEWFDKSRQKLVSWLKDHGVVIKD